MIRHVNTNTPSTGLDLKVERVRAKLPATAIAKAMGISASRLSRIERDEPVTLRMRDRYLSALATCRTSGTPTAA